MNENAIITTGCTCTQPQARSAHAWYSFTYIPSDSLFRIQPFSRPLSSAAVRGHIQQPDPAVPSAALLSGGHIQQSDPAVPSAALLSGGHIQQPDPAVPSAALLSGGHIQQPDPAVLSAALLSGGHIQQPDPAVSAGRSQCLAVAVHRGKRFLCSTCGEHLPKTIRHYCPTLERYSNANVLAERRETH